VPEIIEKKLPNTKFIALLRNPIDRAFSHWQHSVTHGFEDLSFEDAIAVEEERIEKDLHRIESTKYMDNYNQSEYMRYSYLTAGIYYKHLAKWKELFPEDRLLILKYENFFSDSSNADQVFTFLGVQSLDIERFPVRNVGAYKGSLRLETRAKLRTFFKPYNNKLENMLNTNFDDWV
jgi:hypothetical protein